MTKYIYMRSVDQRQRSTGGSPVGTKTVKSNFLMPAGDRKQSKTALAYDFIRGAIIAMDLPPGASIVEKDLCEALSLSRTPLREAVLQLATESLVLINPGAGTFVNRIILKEVMEGQLTRESLETQLVRLAARNYDRLLSAGLKTVLFQQEMAAEQKDMGLFFRLDNEFHRLICECSGFGSLWRTIRGATGQLDRVRRYALPHGDHYLSSLSEHTSIFEHIEARDEEGAARTFLQHIGHLFDEVALIRSTDKELLGGEDAFSRSSIA